jgi:hypothetical protein
VYCSDVPDPDEDKSDGTSASVKNWSTNSVSCLRVK